MVQIRPLLKVGPTLPPGGGWVGGSLACGWVGYFGFGQFGPKCLLPPRGGVRVGVGGWVGGWVGVTETGHHVAPGTQFCWLTGGSNIDRLSCLSHLGLSQMLKMVCFALFFFVCCPLGQF